ncbi:MAG: DegV family protein [Pseudomonadota bacterium]
MNSSTSLMQIDALQLQHALLAGIVHVKARRDLLNKINVFPVPDGDTGTNLLFTLNSISQRIATIRPRPTEQAPVTHLMDQVADAALDGARGNSGAIMAQFFHGMSEACDNTPSLNARQLADAARAGAKAAWSAMSQPVAGTMPTVLEDFADALVRGVDDGVQDIRSLFYRARIAAQDSLADTPNQLPVLKSAGVVDAGGQGFVDLLDGIWRYIRSGKTDAPDTETAVIEESPDFAADHAMEETYRYCTECLIEGDDLAVGQLRAGLEALEADSLVVAGGGRRARVHIHTDRPGEVFKLCADFGEVRQQKADDMTRQHTLLNQRGVVAVVTDSAADLPMSEIDRLGIHSVPLRLFFGDTEYLDKLSMTPSAFYRMLSDDVPHPQTSQPPPRDFRRQFELLTSHGHDVLSIHVSGKLSGTFQTAQHSANRINQDRAEPEAASNLSPNADSPAQRGHQVSVYDTHNAACGQALMVLYAAEAAANGASTDEIVQALDRLSSKTRTFALARDLRWGVRGGRVKPWMEKMARRLRLNPVLANTVDGQLTARGVIPGRTHAVKRFGRYLLRRMNNGEVYRVLISHTDAGEEARKLRDHLLTAHPEIDACWIEEASPAVGVHAGPGSLIVGLQPWQPPGSEAR